MDNENVKKRYIIKLLRHTKNYGRKLISEIISKINKNSFKKSDFDKLSNNKNALIKKINGLGRAKMMINY